ncbi:MAG: hypothetical protein QXZ44_07115, partial [Ferroplasma sp.]
MRTLINATGSDTIELWYIDGSRISKESFSNRTWIFVSGSGYDLSMLERSLDSSHFLYRHASMENIYGKMDGIQIFMRYGSIKNMAYYIENSFGYKLGLYNVDVNPVLRFMASRKLEFFHINSIYDDDLGISNAIIVPHASGGKIKSVEINGTMYYDRLFSRVFSAIDNSIVVIYSNYNGEFSMLLHEMERHGYGMSNEYSPEKAFDSYGRHSYRPKIVRINGKICIDMNSFIYKESGLAGIIELSRLSSLPPETVSAVTPGTVVSSIEEKEAL